MGQIPLRLTTPAAPFDRWHARLNQSAGGTPPGRTSWATAPGVIPGDRERMPQDLNDTLIQRDRQPWAHQTYVSPAGNGWFNWTESGPRRAPLHMRDVTIIQHTQGSSNTRAQDPIPTSYGTNDGTNVGRLSGNGAVHGLHTTPVQSKPAQFVRAFVTPQMQAGRQNRLSNSRNAGQSYSQTTIHQGGTR